MGKSIPVTALVLFTIMAVCAAAPGTAAAQGATEYQYEVLSPWADADPVTARGVSSRLDTLEGKTIGLFANFKRSAVPQTSMVEKKLREKFPTIQTVLDHSTEANVNEIETANREKFIAWVKSVDAVIATVGD